MIQKASPDSFSAHKKVDRIHQRSEDEMKGGWAKRSRKCTNLCASFLTTVVLLSLLLIFPLHGTQAKHTWWVQAEGWSCQQQMQDDTMSIGIGAFSWASHAAHMHCAQHGAPCTLDPASSCQFWCAVPVSGQASSVSQRSLPHTIISSHVKFCPNWIHRWLDTEEETVQMPQGNRSRLLMRNDWKGWKNWGVGWFWKKNAVRTSIHCSAPINFWQNHRFQFPRVAINSIFDVSFSKSRFHLPPIVTTIALSTAVLS